MKLSELNSLDSSLSILWEKNPNSSVDGICDFKLAKENHLFFIKDKKFLQRWMEKVGSLDFSSCHLVIERKYFETIEEESLKAIKDQVGSLSSCDNVGYAMCYISEYFFNQLTQSENFEVDGRQMGNAVVDSTARIAQNVFIGENVKIGKMVKIHPGVIVQSGSVIGDYCEIFSNVTIYPRVTIGEHVRLHSGVVIGADGFGYNFKDGVHMKVWHMGGVIIHDHVEIGANSTVDSGTFSPTIVREGVKLDNKVQIGHNADVGRGVIICGDGGMAGSSSAGDFTVFGGRAALADDCHLGAGCQVAGGSKVTTSWPAGSVIGGHPARPLKEWMKGIAFVRKESLKKKK